MNNWHNEYMAEYHRQELVKDMEKIYSTETTLHSRVYRPNLFTRAMHSFAGWMISTGRELHERYEIPTAHCHQAHSESYAQ